MGRTGRTIRQLVAFALAALLVACAAREPAPIHDRNGYPKRVNLPREGGARSTRVRPASYVVQKGDTLYGIAWRYDLDHKQIARWNRLREPFTIFPQQRLRLVPPSGGQVTATKPPAPAPRPTPERRPAPTKPVGKPVAKQPTPTQPSTKPAPTAKPPAQSRPPASSSAVRWRWPTDGRLYRTFAATDPGRKGIDIVGTYGQPIKSAAPGEVVYSGSGLIGYGELIIIKHNQQFLSAYGHNRKRLVKEGDQVVAGQTIAEMGSSGTDRSMLHFEIRRDGEPIDPQLYLPRR